MKTKLHNGLANTLRQKARELGVSSDQVPVVVDQVLALERLVGQEISRTMKYRIGAALLHNGGQIIAPACPDYTHRDGRYTFEDLFGGISLLTRLHVEFLRQVAGVIPNCKITILIADHEADDPILCQAVHKTRDEFATLVASSVQETRAFVAEYGWEVSAMTGKIPDLVDQESAHMAFLRTSAEFRRRLDIDTAARMKMYRKINSQFSFVDMLERTIRTAAQYLAMGNFATANNLIVCNHSTVNLCWYKETGTAVLHNPVSVY